METQANNRDAYLAIRTVIELTKTADVLDDVFSRHLAQYGLSRAKFNALMQLRLAPGEGLTLSGLGQKMLVSRANITGLVDRMARDSLVYREPDPRDRRIFRVKITPRAEELLEKLLPIHCNFTAEAISGLKEEEKEMLVNLLLKLRSTLEKL